MSTNFPSALDTFTNPNGSDSLNAAAVPHAEQHANANDAIEALQAKVGINGSAVATSLDYRISTAETGLGGKISSSEKGSADGVATLGFDGKVPSSQLPPLDYIPTSEKGAAGGVAGLDEAGKVPAAQLPSYVDDVLEFANLAGFPATGEAGKIYVALDTNKTYRWSGSAYIYITSGAVDSVAGKTGVVSLVKADVGLGNVDNTSDANKPVSTATQSALDTKAPLSHVGATGAAHGVVTASVAGFMSSADKTKLDGVAISANNYTHPSGDGNLHVPATGTTNNGNVLKAGATAGSLSWGTLAKADVGLGNVDNTSDANKPVSTATQTALNIKESTANKGVANGYAGLDASGKVPAAQLPAIFPAGAVLHFAMAAAPAGWLVCDGSLKSRVTYAALFAAIGTIYGAGDGATTFKLPDLRGEFIRGADGGRGVDAGRALGSAQLDGIRDHAHKVVYNGQNRLPGYDAYELTANVEGYATNFPMVNPANETRPRNVALLPCISTGGV